MLTVRVGKMVRRQNFRRKALQLTLVLVPVVLILTLILQRSTGSFREISDDVLRSLSHGSQESAKKSAPKEVGPCERMRECPNDHLIFFIQSGAANAVAPKICLQNKLVLGTSMNNAGAGMNVVIINGKTGDVTNTGHYNMYDGDVKPLIELLKSLETGSVVLMASYDDPSTKLNEDARQLISELGSSSVKSLGFRDNWVFVGGKGASVQSNFEKYLKNDKANNKYDNWPEMVEIEGCIPKYLN